ncbi:TPA: T9SS type A sorting domain-containing protein, partial [Candidatus Poribacteria bacterium]|nr:T9SS type A sorting domain-containing protein [Candidatus Poribacteria bacterium]
KDKDGRYDLIAEVPEEVDSYVDEPLQDGVRYWYILRCTDGKYISSPTSPVDVIPINNFAPSPPEELRLEGFDGDRINMSWSSVPGAVGYKVRYGFKSGDYRRTVDVGPTTSWSLIPIAQINHFIVVSAYDGHGNESLFSKELAVLPRDDDTDPPTFLESEPKKVKAGSPFKIRCSIKDRSGVQDGSVYLVWDDDGEIEIDSNTVPMVRVSGDIFETATSIPPQRKGAKFLYCIFAADDDHDMGNEEDRSLGGSNLRHIEVVSGGDEIYVYPNPVSEVLNLHYALPDEAQLDMMVFDVSGSPVRKLKQIARGGKGNASWRVDLPSGVYIYRLRISYPNLGGQNEEIFRGKFAVVR